MPHYEAIIGLEVHVELGTETKIFCACSTAFGAPPNTQCCPICMGLPGALPALNRRAVELAVRAGLALGCQITEESRIDRKQYFYPDLPKAYQISQYKHPLCENGALTLHVDGQTRRIAISRIHIEEDAGKLIHEGEKTYIDCNRCGVPLIEIVSAPELHTPEEAGAYLRTLRSLLVTCGVSDCRMQEGEFRCDVNISLREAGSDGIGERIEIKNLNSFAFTEKALQYEIARQTAILSRGERIPPETRRFNAATGKTLPMRVKERVVDYRFLFEPDLPPILVSKEEIAAIGATLPELPEARRARLINTFGISEYDASVLVSDPALADFFEAAASHTAFFKPLVNLLLSDLLRFCREEPFVSPISPSRFAELCRFLGEGTINSSTAKKLLARLIEGDFDLQEVISREELAQIRDQAVLYRHIVEVAAANPRAVADWKRGRTAALQALQGQVMARTGGRADPILTKALLLEELSTPTE